MQEMAAANRKLQGEPTGGGAGACLAAKVRALTCELAGGGGWGVGATSAIHGLVVLVVTW